MNKIILNKKKKMFYRVTYTSVVFFNHKMFSFSKFILLNVRNNIVLCVCIFEAPFQWKMGSIVMRTTYKSFCL